MKLYVVEPRSPDGTLDASRPMVPAGSGFPVEGVTEDQLFDFYFKHHEGVGSVNSGDVYDWYKTLGYFIRSKTW